MIGAQFRSVTEIAPKSLFPYLNRSPSRYGFRAGAKTFRYSVNVAFEKRHSEAEQKHVCPYLWYHALPRELILYGTQMPGGGGGDSHMKQTGMLVGNFEFNS